MRRFNILVVISRVLSQASFFAGTFDIFSKGGSSYFSFSAITILDLPEQTLYQEFFLAMKFLEVNAADTYKTAENQKAAALVLLLDSSLLLLSNLVRENPPRLFPKFAISANPSCDYY